MPYLWRAPAPRVGCTAGWRNRQLRRNPKRLVTGARICPDRRGHRLDHAVRVCFPKHIER